MVRVCVEGLSLLVLAAARPAPATPPPPPAAAIQLATAQSLVAVQQCLRAQLADAGRVTAINSAGGVMLDLAFDNVDAAGRVATGHLNFTIQDQGTQRTVTAGAPNAADDALANQLLSQSARRCLPDATGQRPGAPPPSLLEKKG